MNTGMLKRAVSLNHNAVSKIAMLTSKNLCWCDSDIFGCAMRALALNSRHYTRDTLWLRVLRRRRGVGLFGEEGGRGRLVGEGSGGGRQIVGDAFAGHAGNIGDEAHEYSVSGGARDAGGEFADDARGRPH